MGTVATKQCNVNFAFGKYISKVLVDPCSLLFVSALILFPRSSQAASANQTKMQLCAVLMGTTLGPKIVSDARTSLESRSADEEISAKLEKAFEVLPTSIDDLAKESPKTWCLI